MGPHNRLALALRSLRLNDACELGTWLLDGPGDFGRRSVEKADEFWARRRNLFFKPATGYGSKAAYRGDKITRRVFDEVLQGSYVAQALVPPSSRTLQRDGAPVDLKLDLRCYSYAAEIQLIAARLWQGQTTNFRTPGGGFAPVLTMPARVDDADPLR